MNHKSLFAAMVSLALLAACAPAPTVTPIPLPPTALPAKAPEVAPATQQPPATLPPAPTAVIAPTAAAVATKQTEPTKPAPTATTMAMDHGAMTDTMKTDPTATARSVAATAVPVPVAGKQVTINISLFQFQPNVVEVPVGTTVTWINGDLIEHSVTQGNTPGTPGGVWDSGFFTKGKSFSYKFDKPGEFKYFCARHNSMTGIVRVVG